MKRDFEQERGEDATTFKWSHDGNFIAKILKKSEQAESAEEKK
jgi:hypothetical protein